MLRIPFKRLLGALQGAAWLLCAAGAVAVTLEEGPMVMRLAERGSAGAQVLLAGMYLRGEGGVARDDRKAAEWLEKAAVQGNDYGAMKLGDLYEAGRGVPQNARLAADWREKAANRGNVKAQRLLGRMYLDGNGVPRDDGKAEYWLNRVQDAVYPTSLKDADGKEHSGAHKYVMHFPKGQLPPAHGFWSVTMHNAQYSFVDNPINRYSISARQNLQANPDGSVDLYIQHQSPGKDKESNWLPAPPDKFALIVMMRMYWPSEETPSIINGTWSPSAARRVS